MNNNNGGPIKYGVHKMKNNDTFKKIFGSDCIRYFSFISKMQTDIQILVQNTTEELSYVDPGYLNFIKKKIINYCKSKNINEYTFLDIYSSIPLYMFYYFISNDSNILKHIKKSMNIISDMQEKKYQIKNVIKEFEKESKQFYKYCKNRNAVIETYIHMISKQIILPFELLKKRFNLNDNDLPNLKRLKELFSKNHQLSASWLDQPTQFNTPIIDFSYFNDLCAMGNLLDSIDKKYNKIIIGCGAAHVENLSKLISNEGFHNVHHEFSINGFVDIHRFINQYKSDYINGGNINGGNINGGNIIKINWLIILIIVLIVIVLYVIYNNITQTIASRQV
jgi:hypothetical protein